MNYGLKTWPDPVLNKRCSPVAAWVGDPTVQSVIDLMKQVVIDMDGLGLAGNQVGYLGRVIVVKLCGISDFVVMINPKITTKAGAQRAREGCLSLPGLRVMTTRSAEITVNYDGMDGDTVTQTLEGIDAVVVLHEIDHLDGKTLADHPAARKQDTAGTPNKRILDKLKSDYVHKERV
jgi:peptide deformylase